MSLKEQITEDMKTAMRAKDSERLGTIRLLLAALKQKEVDERVELDDAAVVAIVDKLVKQRKDSVTAFTTGGRPDLADKEASEIKVLEVYLPQRMDADEVAAVWPVLAMTDPPLEPASTVRALMVFANLFGHLSQELFGHLHKGVLDYDTHFARVVDQLASDLGLLGPPIGPVRPRTRAGTAAG